MSINYYMTPAEAAYQWGIPQETVKSKLKPSINKKLDDMIDRGLIKYFQHPEGKRREWIISADAMKEWFGEKKN
ncbi:hypothetical protein HMSSN139_66100 [Paenibacillus sp. HMSSN-139]|nr:hypothetical protein HMSSN139_66100 [Paenibacillus sp. HMSSN-139]